MSVQLYNSATDELTQVAGEEFNDTVIRVSALPTATADLINETYLLVADQTGYTKGGIYQCQYVNDAFTWMLVNGSGIPVDVVEDGNMNGVTSNAVADKLVDYAKKPSSSTANNLASLDANGNLVDSGATIKNGGTKVLALKGYSTTDAVDLNTLKATGVYSVTSQLASNLPDSSFLAWWQIIVINKSTTNSGYCSQIAMARNNSIYMRDCENDTWTAWKQIVTDVIRDVAVTRTGAASNSGVFVKQYGNIVQVNFAALVSASGSDTPSGTSLYTGFPKPALTTVRFSLNKAENKYDACALFQIDENGVLRADGQGLSYSKAFWGSYTYLTD